VADVLPSHAVTGMEIACNILDSALTPPPDVEKAVRQLAEDNGIAVGEPYRIGKSPEALTALAIDVLRQQGAE
jgi:hypothetical protein